MRFPNCGILRVAHGEADALTRLVRIGVLLRTHKDRPPYPPHTNRTAFS
jgi:hypothetical protein